MIARLLWSFGPVTAFTAFVVHALATPVPNVVDMPLAHAESGWSQRAVPLLETAGPPPPVYVLSLRTGDPDAILAHGEIRILFATYGRTARVLDAALEVSGTSCVYEVAPDTRMFDNAHLAFVRGTACSAPGGMAAGALRLRVTLADRQPIAVWTYQPPERIEAAASAFIFADRIPGYHGPPPILRGRYADELPGGGARRIDLLNYVWQVSEGTTWIWLCVMTAMLLIAVGACVFPMRPLAASKSILQFRVAAVVATGSFAAALGILYAVIVPPFQAPDEPDHLLSYARLTDEPAISDTAVEWAKLMHLRRIQFNSHERFRPADVGAPFAEPWIEDVFAEPVAGRSSTTARLWLLASPYLRGLSVPRQLLSIRSINVLLFSAAVIAGVALLSAVSAAPHPQLLASAFFIIPTLPFFATHMSEWAVLTSIYLFLSCVLLYLFLDGPRSHWMGLALGLCSALLASSGRSAFPMAPILLGALLARMVLGSEGSEARRSETRDAAVFWGGFSVGLAGFWLVATDAYVGYVGSVNSRPPPEQIAAVAAWIWRSPWLALVVAAAGWGGEMVGSQCRHRLRRRAGTMIRGLTRLVAFAGAAFIMLVLVGSIFIDYPHLQTLGAAYQPSLSEYIVAVLETALTSARFGDPDLLLSTLFWGGFGWVDTIPRSAVISTLVVATGVSAVALLVELGRRRDARQVVWIAIGLFGLVASLAIYAVATYQAQRNLYGRYLVGPYLVWLTIAWSSIALIRGRSAPRLQRVIGLIPRPAPILIGAAALHAYCLRLILMRYF